MGGNLIVGKRLPLRKEADQPTSFPLKKAEVFQEESSVTKMREKDQKRAFHPLPPQG
jgi:hypothetical protein